MYTYRQQGGWQLANRVGTIRGRLVPAASGGIFGGPAGEFAVDFGASGEAGLFKLVSDMPGMVDSKVGLASIWFHMPASANRALMTVDPSNAIEDYFRITIDNSRRLLVVARNPGGGTGITFVGSNSVLVALNAWHHILVSWDTAQDVIYAYLDDVDAWTGAVTNNITLDFEVAYNEHVDNEVQIAGGDLIGNPLLDCLGQFWFDSNQFLDITIEANRRRFTEADGSPIALGPDGSTPTGVQPLLYFENPVQSYHVNRGSGGNFTVFGTPANCDDTPADQF